MVRGTFPERSANTRFKTFEINPEQRSSARVQQK
jgi:hypothetical protein